MQTNFDAERLVDHEQFATATVFENERLKVACGYFQPGQFIPVHAPGSDVVIAIQAGRGRVRDGSTDRDVTAGDIVVVPAGTDRGVKADDQSRLEALLVTSPPPTEEEHAPVRRGLRTDQFEP